MRGLHVLRQSALQLTSRLERSRWRGGRPSVRGGLRNSVVAEKGVLCEHTYAANAGGTRPAQLRRNNDPLVHQSGGAFPAAHQ